MHGHDPYFARTLLHIALDLDIGGGEPAQKTLQARGIYPLVVEGEIEKGGKQVVCFMAEAGKDALTELGRPSANMPAKNS